MSPSAYTAMPFSTDVQEVPQGMYLEWNWGAIGKDEFAMKLIKLFLIYNVVLLSLKRIPLCINLRSPNT